MQINGPLGFFPNSGMTAHDQYANPFYGIPAKFLPQNMDEMLQWANHFLVRFSFYRAALGRVANYFITSLHIECEDSDAKRKYEEMFDELEWKSILAKAGLDLLAYGNVFLSVNQGFDRFLACPQCGKISALQKIKQYEFDKEARFIYSCPACKFKGPHEVIDKSSKDLKRTSVTFWNPRDVIVFHEYTTDTYEYYWNIPADYSRQVMRKNDKFFNKCTPKAIYDAILQQKLLAFNNKNFIHQRMPTPSGMPSEGKSVPPCIYLFDDFFMLKVLERFNQAICFEDIIPFRVFSLSNDANPNNNMVLNQNAGQWRASVENMIQEHRRDPGSYQTFPFPLAYQQLGGDAKNLVTPELIQLVVNSLLNALNIPQELYSMNLQTQAIGPALRLFENSWSSIVGVYNNLLDHWGEVCAKIAGLPKAKISLTPVTLADDMERKSVISQLVSANAIARSELLSLYGFEYKDQVRKKLEEDDTTQELTQEAQTKKQLREMAEAGQMGSGGGQGATSPQDVLANAQEIAQQLFPLDPAQRRSELQKIKATDATLYSAVKQALEETTNGAKSQGVQGAKQQAQGGQAGQGGQPGAQ